MPDPRHPQIGDLFILRNEDPKWAERPLVMLGWKSFNHCPRGADARFVAWDTAQEREVVFYDRYPPRKIRYLARVDEEED